MEVKQESLRSLNAVNAVKHFKYKYQQKICKWYPDFRIGRKYYEIKPDDGNWQQKDSKERCLAKKQSCSGVIWVGNDKIKEMAEVVGDVSQYRQKKI